MRFFHGDSISNSVISLSPRVTARLIADCPTPRSLHALHGFENTPAAGTAQQASAGQFRSFPLVEAFLDKTPIVSPGRFLLFAK